MRELARWIAKVACSLHAHIMNAVAICSPRAILKRSYNRAAYALRYHKTRFFGPNMQVRMNTGMEVMKDRLPFANDNARKPLRTTAAIKDRVG